MNQVGFKKEKSLILACLRAAIAINQGSSFHLKDLQEDFLSGLDWDFILKTAETHHILPFVALALKRAGGLSKLPLDRRRKISEGLSRGAAENLVKVSEFRKINRSFQEEEISVAPLKGIALTELIYEEIPIRQMADIDLLIRDTDFEKAEKLLSRLGFKRQACPYAWQDRIYMRLLGRWSYLKDGLDIDLQWKPGFFIGGCFTEWDSGRMWKRDSPSLSPLGQAQYLLLQIANDMDRNSVLLLQLFDLAFMMKKYGLNSEDLLKVKNELSPLSPRAETKLKEAVRMIEELFFEEKDSSQTGSIFEERWKGPTELWRGRIILKAPLSWWEKMVFMAGYLFPSSGHRYEEHWRRLASKVGRLLLDFLWRGI